MCRACACRAAANCATLWRAVCRGADRRLVSIQSDSPLVDLHCQTLFGQHRCQSALSQLRLCFRALAQRVGSALELHYKADALTLTIQVLEAQHLTLFHGSDSCWLDVGRHAVNDVQ